MTFALWYILEHLTFNVFCNYAYFLFYRWKIKSEEVQLLVKKYIILVMRDKNFSSCHPDPTIFHSWWMVLKIYRNTGWCGVLSKEFFELSPLPEFLTLWNKCLKQSTTCCFAGHIFTDKLLLQSIAIFANALFP